MKKILGGLAFALLALLPAQAAPPYYYGEVRSHAQPVYDITYYGADPLDVQSSVAALKAAICQAEHGNTTCAAGTGTGGTILIPSGKFKIDSCPITQIDGTVGGIEIAGTGVTQYNAVGGSILDVRCSTGDVFQVPASNYGGPSFHDFMIDASNVTRSSGATINIKAPNNASVYNMYTNRDYDAVAWGTPGVDSQAPMMIHDSTFFQVRHVVFHQQGDTNGGGTYIHHILTYGNGAEYAAGTNYCYLMDPASVIVDPMYVDHVDCEGLAWGAVADLTSGYMADAFWDHIIFDGVKHSAMRFRTGGTANIGNFHASDIWGTTSSNEDAFLFDAENITSGFSQGISMLSLNAIHAGSASGNCIELANGVISASLTNIHAYQCASGIGIALSGSSAAHLNTNIGIHNARIGALGVNTAISMACSDRVTITGTDTSGSTTSLNATGETAVCPTTNTIAIGNVFASAISVPGPYNSTIITGNAGNNLTGSPYGSGGATINAGAGAPAGACVNGSSYINSTGGVGSTLYACTGGTWHAAASP